MKEKILAFVNNPTFKKAMPWVAVGIVVVLAGVVLVFGK